MLIKLPKIKGIIWIFFSRVVTYESVHASLQSFKKTLLNHFKKSPGDIMVYDENSSFGAVKKCWWKNWMSILYCRCYAVLISASLFNQIIICLLWIIICLLWIALETFYPVLSNMFSNSWTVLVVIVKSLYDIIHLQANSGCQEHNGTEIKHSLYAYKFAF